MRGTAYKSILIASFMLICAAKIATAQSSAAKDYQQDCAECHGADGKDARPEMRTVPGYVSIDLTQISIRNGGEFPRERVYEEIDGRHRIAAHFRGAMPRWGARYSIDETGDPEAERRVRERISALVDFVESMQEK